MVRDTLVSNRMSIFSGSGSGLVTLLTPVQEPDDSGPDKVLAGELG